MNFLAKIFTWWTGATIGTLLNSWLTGEHVGTDIMGNKYYRAKRRSAMNNRERRWVIYPSSNDASHVPPLWHGWLHHTQDNIPDEVAPFEWEKPASPSLTGTKEAYLPSGALQRGGQRAPARGDFEAWSPDDAPTHERPG